MSYQFQEEGFGHFEVPTWVTDMIDMGECDDNSYHNDAMPIFKFHNICKDNLILVLYVNAKDKDARDIDCVETKRFGFQWESSEKSSMYELLEEFNDDRAARLYLFTMKRIYYKGD